MTYFKVNPNIYLQQINDSSVIISLLESFLEDRNVSMDKLVTYYPSMEGVDARGKKKLEFPNRYFIMYGEKKCKRTAKEMKWVFTVDQPKMQAENKC